MNKEDILNRQPFIDNVVSFVNMLSEEKRGCSFAIDGKWGVGKTFVIEKIENELEKIQSEESADNRYYLFHYNCWKYDYYSEPAVAIVSAMLDNANAKFESGIWEFAKGILKEIARDFVINNIGIDVVEVASKVTEKEKEEMAFDEWFSFKKTLDSIRKKMQKIAQNKTMIIVVDELDRCLPEYAIKVLERVHHFFDGLNNIIVVFTIDSVQLEHSVKKIYGNETDVEKYLKKFISFKMTLDNGDLQDTIWNEFSNYFSMFHNKFFCDEDDVRKIIITLFDKVQLDIRQREKILEFLLNIHVLSTNESQDYSIMLFEVLVVLFISVQKRFDERIISALASIDSRENSILTSEIGDELYNYIVQLVKGCYDAPIHSYVNRGEFYECISSISVAVYILKEIYLDKNPLGDADSNKYKAEIEVCTRFLEYIRFFT